MIVAYYIQTENSLQALTPSPAREIQIMCSILFAGEGRGEGVKIRVVDILLSCLEIVVLSAVFVVEVSVWMMRIAPQTAALNE